MTLKSKTHLRSRFGFAIVIFNLLPCSAVAQDSGPLFRTEVPAYDEAGVDVSSGAFTQTIPLFEGNDANPGWMDFRYQYNLNRGWSENTSGSASVVDRVMQLSYAGDSEIVVFGTTVQRSWRGSTILSLDANGNEMTQHSDPVPPYVVWIRKDGSRIKYIQEYRFAPGSPSSGGDYRLLSAAMPDGTVYDYHYKAMATNSTTRPTQYRLQSITNNRGYQLKFDYMSQNPNEFLYLSVRSAFLVSKITQINNAIEYCDPMADSCTLSQSWPNALVANRIWSTTTNSGLTVTKDGREFTDSLNGHYTFSSELNIRPGISREGEFRFKTPAATSPNVVYKARWIGRYDRNGVNIANDLTHRVYSADHNGRNWTYTYQDDWVTQVPGSLCGGGTPRIIDMTSTDPSGSQTQYRYHRYFAPDCVLERDPDIYFFPSRNFLDDAKSPASVPGGPLRETKYVWNPDGTVANITYPEGNKLVSAYDDRRNLTSQTAVSKPPAAASISRSSAFPASSVQSGYTGVGQATRCTEPVSCNKPSHSIDERGNRTDYSYAPGHGGILTEMKPAPVPGAARPLAVYTYIQKFGYSKNASGALVPQTTPVWLPSTMTICQTAAASNVPVCDNAAPVTVTNYQYGVDGTTNSLLVHGLAVTAGGQTLRTCFGYDRLGRQISETKPAADLVVCP